MAIYLKRVNNGKGTFDKVVYLSDDNNVFKFMQRVIDSSGKSADELTKMKSKDILKLILNHKDCTFSEEEAAEYDVKPIVRVFKRILSYNLTFDPYTVKKDCDGLVWWAYNAPIDERLDVLTNVHWGKHGWTSAMQDTIFRALTPTDLYRIFERVEDENWKEFYGKESKNDKEVFNRNNVYFKLLANKTPIRRRNYELYLPFYDKIARVVQHRRSKKASYQTDVSNILSTFRKADPRVFLSIGNHFETYESGRAYSVTDSFFGAYCFLRRVDTDCKGRARRYCLGSSWGEPDYEAYRDTLVWGRHDSRGLGYPSVMTTRMGLWQPI